MNVGTWLIGLGCVLCVGCGESDGGNGSGSDGLSEAAVESFEGIYQVTTFTENDTGCDGPGADVLATSSDQYFVLVSDQVFGIATLMLISCSDVDDCNMKVSSLRNRESFGFQFGATLSEEVNDSTLTGFTAFTGFEEGGVCVMREYEENTLTRAGNTATLDTVVKGLDDRPAEDGFCTVNPSAAQEEAAGAPCVASSSVVGDRVADLQP